MLSLVLRSSLQVEVLDVSDLCRRVQGTRAPRLPDKPQSASLSLWSIEQQVRIKITSAKNVYAGDLMRVSELFYKLFYELFKACPKSNSHNCLLCKS